MCYLSGPSTSSFHVSYQFRVSRPVLGTCAGPKTASRVASTLLQEHWQASDGSTLRTFLLRDLFALDRIDVFAVQQSFRGCWIECICSPHQVSAVNRHGSTANLWFHFQGLARLHSKAHLLQTGLALATPRPAHGQTTSRVSRQGQRLARENRPSNVPFPRQFPR